MRVAWVAHHDLDSPIGGAEFTDKEMIACRPPGIKVDLLPPSRYVRLKEYDRVVVSRLEQMPTHAAQAIADTKPVFFSHGDVLPRTEATKLVVQNSRPFIALTPLSLRHIDDWAGGIDGIAMVPYMDLEGITVGEKEDFALWPHRDIWHKGKDLARDWAARRGVKMVFMSGRPRSEVLEVMSRARWVVLLSKILDGGPRAIREAQLSGCEIVVNDLVGWWDLPRDELERRTLEAPERFWRIVCE